MMNQFRVLKRGETFAEYCARAAEVGVPPLDFGSWYAVMNAGVSMHDVETDEPLATSSATPPGGWQAFGGGYGFTHYSPRLRYRLRNGIWRRLPRVRQWRDRWRSDRRLWSGARLEVWVPDAPVSWFKTFTQSSGRARVFALRRVMVRWWIKPRTITDMFPTISTSSEPIVYPRASRFE